MSARALTPAATASRLVGALAVAVAAGTMSVAASPAASADDFGPLAAETSGLQVTQPGESSCGCGERFANLTLSTPAQPAPVRPVANTVTCTFHVERYVPRTAAQARLVAALDDDGRLTSGEDRPLTGVSTSEFVTVTVAANASAARVVEAIDARTHQVGDVRTTAKTTAAVAGRATVVAWELGRSATSAQAWGRTGAVAQTFFARS